MPNSTIVYAIHCTAVGKISYNVKESIYMYFISPQYSQKKTKIPAPK